MLPFAIFLLQQNDRFLFWGADTPWPPAGHAWWSIGSRGVLPLREEQTCAQSRRISKADDELAKVTGALIVRIWKASPELPSKTLMVLLRCECSFSNNWFEALSYFGTHFFRTKCQAVTLKLLSDCICKQHGKKSAFISIFQNRWKLGRRTHYPKFIQQDGTRFWTWVYMLPKFVLFLLKHTYFAYLKGKEIRVREQQKSPICCHAFFIFTYSIQYHRLCPILKSSRYKI